ncbi:hypothetical protein CYMTET_53493 [Cymbomonas tetramitiformis]|uniref:Rieske domain-containing protein n=1 Tax=Cymbomonas tetramitiformis TaxID=36881 RepID=A0AAE0BIL8_9CHLO|nr:hypothetical protein CYMTET_53493 [Cymbomonas tetramitiformis]
MPSGVNCKDAVACILLRNHRARAYTSMAQVLGLGGIRGECHHPALPFAVCSFKAATWTKAATKKELEAADGGRMVVELNGTKVLLATVDDEVYAVSNKCSHLGLPLVGKTGLLQAKISDKCVVCPAHGTSFDLATGDVKGEWCPKLPNLPLVGKGPKEAPLPTFESRVGENGEIEVLM